MFIAEKRTPTPVSIVIPVHDRLDLTRQCLASLFKHTPPEAAEIIVVDNGSTDGTTDELRELEDDGRIRTVLHAENLGFARACNAGAAAARHPYVLFLNNDTEATPDWLGPLVRVLDLDPKVGAAGSRLLFPDGTVQHAGVAVTVEERPQGRYLAGEHLCYRKPADFPAANQPQILRALTAACLLVRADAFAAVGGFHEGYWNGNEDMDLCLALDAAGWTLVYQPESTVVHYESQSGPERWSRVSENVELLTSRWLERTDPDYFRDAEGRFTPAPSFSVRTYAQPRLRFPDVRTGGGETTASVVVLNHNTLEDTRRCAESLLRHTDPRHELIFVDNGSTDGTPEYLRGLCAENPRCFGIYNRENLGFAAGNNQGLAFARGEHVVLLNSDTVVTEGWLEILLQAAAEHPQAGLIGAVTNSIAGSQKLPKVGYDQETLRDLDLFARMHREATRGNDELVLWLTGFCLLITRDLLTRIGGLDERFGRGNFEDNDYCLRAFLAGYQSLIATDCFVHHAGSRSFRAAGVDYDAELEAKWEIFKAKWNIPSDTPYGGAFDLERILAEGFDPVLHFQPLPAAAGVQRIAPAPSEYARVLARGGRAFAAGRLADAERLFRWVLLWAEGHARAANDLAVALWRQGRGDEAETILRGVLERNPDDGDAAWNLQEIRRAARQASPATATEVAPEPADAPVEV